MPNHEHVVFWKCKKCGKIHIKHSAMPNFGLFFFVLKRTNQHFIDLSIPRSSNVAMDKDIVHDILAKMQEFNELQEE